jgi:hypothetical protein
MCIGDVEQQPGCHSSGKRQCDCEAVKIPGMTMLKDRKERRAIDRIEKATGGCTDLQIRKRFLTHILDHLGCMCPECTL